MIPNDLEYGLDPQGRLRFFGIYAANVIDNKDPLNKGRLKLQIFQPTGIARTVWAPQCVGALPQPNYPYATFLSTLDQTVTAANTATVVTLNTTEDDNGGIYLSNNRIYVSEQGDYFLNFSAIFSKANASSSAADIWLRKNGTDIPRSNTRVEVAGNPGEKVVTVGYILDLDPGDYIQFVFSSPDHDMTLTAHTGLTNPTRPDIPSIIATLNLVGKYVPRVNTKVWVMFEAGDPDYPVWMGGIA